MSGVVDNTFYLFICRRDGRNCGHRSSLHEGFVANVAGPDSHHRHALRRFLGTAVWVQDGRARTG